ncbi:hypothetical protein [Rhizobacter sp. OV335]|uniref:hypothetical protein n=1 Tax=Rhizobacter sp. OV335 TaxID=1500264 RepID=UPI00093717CB|nr:hypothetical protein [Rhizobacter sp. OV335]
MGAVLFGGLVSFAASASAQPPVQRCAGAVCLREPHLTEDAFVEKFGTGAVLTDADEPRRHQHCFFLGASSRWILFTFERASTQRTSELVSILISSIELCTMRVPPKMRMGQAATEGGVALGHQRADIERVLGRPHRLDQVAEGSSSASNINDYSPRLGRTRLVYEIENDTLFNFFYLSDSGELSSILLADTP